MQIQQMAAYDVGLWDTAITIALKTLWHRQVITALHMDRFLMSSSSSSVIITSSIVIIIEKDRIVIQADKERLS